MANFLTMIRDLADFRAVIRDLANFLTVIRDLGVPWGASFRKRHVWSSNGMSVSEILYGFMFVGIVLANVIVLADDNWRERQIVPHTIRIFVGCSFLVGGWSELSPIASSDSKFITNFKWIVFPGCFKSEKVMFCKQSVSTDTNVKLSPVTSTILVIS